MTSGHSFKRKVPWLYGVLVAALCFLCITARWYYHREPCVTETSETTHEDIDGECIITKVRTTTTSKSVAFPQVGTTVVSDTFVVISNDAHLYMVMGAIMEKMSD